MEKGIIFIIKRTSNFVKKRKEIEEKLCNPERVKLLVKSMSKHCIPKDSSHFQDGSHCH